MVFMWILLAYMSDTPLILMSKDMAYIVNCLKKNILRLL